MDAVFFATPDEFRAWLEANHEQESELVVGFHKTGTGRPSMTWTESVKVALCFGWIDGLVQRIDSERYSRRFTPRRPRSIWSAVNVRYFAELEAAGLVVAAGHKAFAQRTEERTGIYSHEQAGTRELSPEAEARLRAEPEAWDYFAQCPSSYRKAAIHWVLSAKLPETRERRLVQLIAACGSRQRVAPLRWERA